MYFHRICLYSRSLSFSRMLSSVTSHLLYTSCFPLSATQSSLGPAWLTLDSSWSFMVRLEVDEPAGPRPIDMRMGSRSCGEMREAMREREHVDLTHSLTVCIVFCCVFRRTDNMDIGGWTQSNIGYILYRII